MRRCKYLGEPYIRTSVQFTYDVGIQTIAVTRQLNSNGATRKV
jgi:hypothetical protein